MRYQVRPLSDRTWLGQQKKLPTQFRSKWAETERLLIDEVQAIKGTDLVLGIDIAESDLRVNGELRANAKPTSSGVEVAFQTPDDALVFRCDRFYTNWAHQGEDWRHNVHAIALTLKALRSVDRYGASSSGEQYRGYRQIEAAAAAAHMTHAAAWQVLAEMAGMPSVTAGSIMRDTVIRRAMRAAHPDTGGSAATWHQFTAARAIVQGLAP